jgi:hypothetical protein
MQQTLSREEHLSISTRILLGAVKARAERGGANTDEDIRLALRDLDAILAASNYFELIRRAAILVEGGGSIDEAV